MEGLPTPAVFSVVGEVRGDAWVENLADGVGVVAVFFEDLGEGGEVAHGVAPVAVEVVEVEGVGAAACEEGVAAGGAKGLLKQYTSFVTSQ